MTGTPGGNVRYEYGLEHAVVPGSTPVWETANIDFEDTIYVLEGFRIRSRAYIDTITTYTDNQGNTTETRTRTYPTWTLNTQELVKSSPDRQVFTTDEGTELFANLPQVGLGVSEAGITDGTAYDYFRVFDKTEFEWLPRNASNNQDYISNKRFPQEPYNEGERPRVQYNIDAVNKLIPDDRECVTITYTLTTNWTQPNELFIPITLNDTLTVTQDVCQPLEDWAGKLKAIINRSAYAHGYYHMSLYPVNANRNYSVEGVPRGTTQIEVYDIEDNLVRTECFNNKGNRVGSIIEPVYPLIGDGRMVIRNGECVDVVITNAGRFYPHNFYVTIKQTVYNNQFTGGVPPLIKAHVSPISRGRPRIVNGELREGALSGGEITRFEVVDPGENLDPERPPVMNFDSYDLSNTVVDYGQQFSYNKLNSMPLIKVENRTPDD